MKTFESISILIVDDDPDFIEILSYYLHALQVGAVASVSSFKEGLLLAKQKNYDLAILDVHLDDDQSGLDLGSLIQKMQPHIGLVFLSSFFNAKTYNNIVDQFNYYTFCSKEISKLKIRTVLTDVLQMINLTQANQKTNTPPDNYFFRVGDTYKHIPVEEVFYFCSQESHVYGKGATRNYSVNVSLKELEARLADTFIRIHKKYLMNRQFVKSLRFRENTIQLSNDEILPIGRTYQRTVLDKFNIIK